MSSPQKEIYGSEWKPSVCANKLNEVISFAIENIYKSNNSNSSSFHTSCCVQLRTQFTALLMNLILGELLVSGLGLPMDALAALQRGWKMGRHACVATGFVLTTLGIAIDMYYLP